MSEDYTPDMLAMLERQRAYFSSDEHILERARPWRGASAEDCWIAVVEACRDAEWMLGLMDAETRERALRPEPFPDRVLAALEAMQQR